MGLVKKAAAAEVVAKALKAAAGLAVVALAVAGVRRALGKRRP